MTLDQISITNFQSLRSVTLPIAPFTVIVGPSSSGKSAFVRALQTLTHNARGASFITQGQPGCSISATFSGTEPHTVTLTRSRTSSASDAYVLDGLRFTKLGGSTPPEVTAALGQAADPAAIASQFDPPYLLTQSPAEAARTLAQITNASVVLDAARESNRRRLETASTLRIRTADSLKTAENLASHGAHAARTAHLALAEAHSATALALSNRLGDLEGLVVSIDYIRHGVRTLRDQLTATQLPDLDELDAAANKISALGSLLDDIAGHIASRRTQSQLIHDLDEQLVALEDERIAYLHDLGVCPTCGQATDRLHDPLV